MFGLASYPHFSPKWILHFSQGFLVIFRRPRANLRKTVRRDAPSTMGEQRTSWVWRIPLPWLGWTKNGGHVLTQNGGIQKVYGSVRGQKKRGIQCTVLGVYLGMSFWKKNYIYIYLGAGLLMFGAIHTFLFSVSWWKYKVLATPVLGVCQKQTWSPCVTICRRKCVMWRY